MNLSLVAAIVALLTCTPEAAASRAPQAGAEARQPAPRETVRAVAARIREFYFDPVRAEQIAAELETAAAAGEFDALTDGRGLAGALTTRLRPADGHFRVVFSPGGAAPAEAGPAAGPDQAGVDLEARGHYGFRKAEILPGNVGYIDLRQFSRIDFDDPADPARAAADAALDFVRGADAVIFDLRGNGGGEPSMVGYLTSAFTPAGAPIYNVFHSRGGTESEAPRVLRADPRLDVPVYMLIDRRSGSAAEAFPYTLQAAGRATVVGETSAGAANPGELIAVGGGFAVFVSDGSPRNPVTGTNWEGTGVQPDVATSSPQALDRAHALALEAILAADPGRTDAAWVLEALRAPARSGGDLSAYAGTFGRSLIAVADGQLTAARQDEDPIRLRRLEGDVFVVEGDPMSRYRFERDDEGRVVGFDLVTPGGPTLRARRSRGT